MDVISLTIDSKKRISLTKLLPPGNIRSVRAYTEGHLRVSSCPSW